MSTLLLVALVAAGSWAALALLRAARRLGGTTLAAPARWGALALALGIAAEVWSGLQPAAGSAGPSVVRYLVGIASVCPLLALLGAKRPQDRAWGWVVLSLWVVLALPAVESWLYRPGRPLELHPAWAWFLLILIVTGALNHLPTRYAPVACLVAAGQVLLMKESLPAPLASPAWPRAGLAMFCAAVALGWMMPAPRIPPSADRVWVDFRNAFGAAWGLRVQERLNACARQQGWPVRLTWQGFRPLAEIDGRDRPAHLAPEDALQGPLAEALGNVLWRFVSPAWIAARLAPCARSQARRPV